MVDSQGGGEGEDSTATSGEDRSDTVMDEESEAREPSEASEEQP